MTRIDMRVDAPRAETFRTGRPCRNGHIAPRYRRNGACVACMRMHNARHSAARSQQRTMEKA